MVVVLVEELVEQGLQLGDGGGLGGWARSHFFRVCWNRSTLPQVVGWFGREFFWVMPEPAQLVLEAGCGRRVPPANRVVYTMPLSVSVEAGIAVLGSGFAEGGQHDRAGDPGVGGDVQGVAGVVVEPGEDLDTSVPSGEPVVGEVGLPGLVRLVGLEPDVGATWAAWTGPG